ncbi:MAG: PcfJ domain-containing protein [Oscillospiraceae bacterium]|nr:PcfJ domain-containing protein [Oscillospiraceae bacterium]
MAGINKRSCGAFLSPDLKLSANSGIIHCRAIKYIIKSEVRLVAHRKLLILYLIPQRKAAEGDYSPAYAIFQSCDSFAACDMTDKGHPKWRAAGLERLEPDERSFTERLAFYSKTDETRVIRFCAAHRAKIQCKTGVTAMLVLQSSIMESRTTKRRNQREQKILDRMKPVRPAGSLLEQWATRDVLPKYIFYDRKERNKPTLGHCTACNQEVSVAGAKHNMRYECPSCHRLVTLKSRGITKHLWDRASILRIDRVAPSEIVIRVFKAFWNYNKGADEYVFREFQRHFISWDADGKCSVDRYYDSFTTRGLTSWRHGQRPRFSIWQQNFSADNDGLLWTRGLSRTLKGSPWQYSEIGAFYDNIRESLNAEVYLAQYLKKPCLEYLVKLRLYRLAKFVAYEDETHYLDGHHEKIVDAAGKGFREVLHVGQEDLPLLQELNASHTQLDFLQSMRRCGMQPSRDLLAWCDANDIRDFSHVMTALRFMTPHKLMRYVSEQFAANKATPMPFYAREHGFYDLRMVLSDYKDYLFMSAGLEYDMTNPFVLFPKDLMKAHNQVMELSSKQKTKVYDRSIAALYPQTQQRFAFQSDGMMVVAPKNAREITREGQSLHHCVGNYVEQVARQETVILFLRLAKAPKKSFYTIEVSAGRIHQVRGCMNQDTTPEVDKFLEKWRRQVLDRPIVTAFAGFGAIRQAA